MADIDKPKTIDPEERRETGTSYMLIGFICLLFAFLVMFFNPAAIRLGKLTMVEVAIGLVILGSILEVVGYRIRTKMN
jgi:hypothetical protein